MRTAARVFTWLGIIFGFYLIYPLIVGIFALKKLSHCNSKQELQNFGIITLFFCSFLGGLFMMLTDDEPQNTHCENTTVITYKKDTISNENFQHNNNDAALISTKICVWALVALSVACLISSIFIVIYPSYYIDEYYYDYVRVNELSAFLTSIPIWVNTVIILIPIIIFIHNKQRIDKKCGVAFTIYLIYIAATFSMTISSAAMACNDYRSATLWIVAALSFIMLILTLVIVITNKFVFKTDHKVKVMKTKLEIELDKIKQLYDNNIVTQTEYEKMRQKIIEKYYNV